MSWLSRTCPHQFWEYVLTHRDTFRVLISPFCLHFLYFSQYIFFFFKKEIMWSVTWQITSPTNSVCNATVCSNRTKTGESSRDTVLLWSRNQQVVYDKTWISKRGRETTHQLHTACVLIIQATGLIILFSSSIFWYCNSGNVMLKTKNLVENCMKKRLYWVTDCPLSNCLKYDFYIEI